jgi:Flp pilus assembly protein TadG
MMTRDLLDDDGGILPFVVLMVSTLMLVIGLSVDGAAAMAASGKALDEASSAARLAAQQIDVDRLRRSGEVVLDPAAAVAAGQRFIAATGDTARVVVNNDAAASVGNRPQARSYQPPAEPAVTVTVTRTVATQFLQWVGIGSFTVTETATSNAIVTGSTS